MASSWGSSWLTSWLNSWGTVGGPAAPETFICDLGAALTATTVSVSLLNSSVSTDIASTTLDVEIDCH